MAVASRVDGVEQVPRPHGDQSARDLEAATITMANRREARAGALCRFTDTCPAIDVIVDEVQSASRIARAATQRAGPGYRADDGGKPCHVVLDAACREDVLAVKLRKVLLKQLEQRSVEKHVVCVFAEACRCLRRLHAREALHALMVELRREHGQGRVQDQIYRAALDRAFGAASPGNRASHGAMGIPRTVFLRFLAGDLDALGHIVGKYAWRRLIRYAQRRWPVHWGVDPEDLVQETFLGLANCMRSGAGPVPETTVGLWHYLVASLNNCARRGWRRHRLVRSCDEAMLTDVVETTPAEVLWPDLAVVLDLWAIRQPTGLGHRLEQHLRELVQLSLELRRVPFAREIRGRLRVAAATASRLRWDLIRSLRAELSKSET